MRKIGIFFIFLLGVGLSGCYKEVSPPDFYLEEESVPSGALLMDVPEDVEVVSQTFRFSAGEMEYIGLENQRLTVTATYVIKNNGEDTTMQMSLPIYPLEILDVDDALSNDISIRVNDEIVDLEWSLMNDFEEYIGYSSYDYETIQLGLENEDVFLSDELIYQYEFTIPQEGKDEELSIYIPEGTKILQDYYSEKQDEITSSLTTLFEYTGGDMVIEPTTKETTSRFYTIGNEAVFTYNYDLRNSFGAKTVEQFSNQTCYNEYCVVATQAALTDFIISDEDIIDIYDIHHYSHSATEKLFTFEHDVELPGNGTETIIEATYFIDGGITSKNHEGMDTDQLRLIYDFYLDQELYLNDDIDITFEVDLPYEVFYANHTIGESNTIIFNQEEGNHIYFEVIFPYIE